MVTGTPDSTTTVSFELVISTWREKVQCEMTTERGTQCSRPATQRINLHGCERALVCGQHVHLWERRGNRNMKKGAARCVHCKEVFDSFEDSYTVRPL